MVLVNVDYIDICSNFQYLENVLPYYDSPDIIEDFSMIYNSIDTQIIELEKLRSKLSSMLESNTQIKKIFKTLENEIIPRFEYFSNFNGCSIGLDNGEILRICFEIKI